MFDLMQINVRLRWRPNLRPPTASCCFIFLSLWGTAAAVRMRIKVVWSFWSDQKGWSENVFKLIYDCQELKGIIKAAEYQHMWLKYQQLSVRRINLETSQSPSPTPRLSSNSLACQRSSRGLKYKTAVMNKETHTHTHTQILRLLNVQFYSFKYILTVQDYIKR